jgi:putative SOS response-associated peptidase YedK
MCGRYASFLPPELIARLFGTTNPLPDLKSNWNMAPTMNAPVVRRHPETGERHLDLLTWGLVPSFTKDLKAVGKPINAKAETVASSGMFRAALAKRQPGACRSILRVECYPRGQGAACDRAGGWRDAGLCWDLGGLAIT